MKKISRSILILCLSGSALIVGCKKDNLQETITQRAAVSNSDSQSISDSIGYWHNYLLGQYYKNNLPKKRAFIDFDITHQNVMTSLSSYAPASFSAEEITSVRAALDNNLIDLEVFKSGIGGQRYLIPFSESLPILVNDLKDRNQISVALATEIINLINIAEDTSPEAFVAMVNEIATKPWSTQDGPYVTIFVQVIDASFNFWYGDGQFGPGEPLSLKPGSGTIIADGVGALYGGLLGPIGSIIYGTCASLYVNELL